MDCRFFFYKLLFWIYNFINWIQLLQKNSDLFHLLVIVSIFFLFFLLLSDNSDNFEKMKICWNQYFLRHSAHCNYLSVFCFSVLVYLQFSCWRKINALTRLSLQDCRFNFKWSFICEVVCPLFFFGVVCPLFVEWFALYLWSGLPSICVVVCFLFVERFALYLWSGLLSICVVVSPLFEEWFALYLWSGLPSICGVVCPLFV